MRIIELGEDREKAKQRFNITAICAFQGKAPGDLEGSRRLAKLQDTIEGHADLEVNGITTTYELRKGVTAVTLEDGPYELLKARFFEAGIAWSSGINRQMLDAYDAVCAAREVKPEDMKPPVAVVA